MKLNNYERCIKCHSSSGKGEISQILWINEGSGRKMVFELSCESWFMDLWTWDEEKGRIFHVISQHSCLKVTETHSRLSKERKSRRVIR